MRCKHKLLRCVHGDEINEKNGARAACAGCGKAIPGDLPYYCYYTKQMHPGVKVALDNDRWP